MHLDKLQWIWHVGSNVAGAPGPGGRKYNYAVAVIINACPSLVPQNPIICVMPVFVLLFSALLCCAFPTACLVYREATESEEENKVGGGGGGKRRGSIDRLFAGHNIVGCLGY